MSTSTKSDHTEISIVIPLYFHKVELYPIKKRCFESVERYYPDAELIVIDDCSPLDTSDFPVTHRKEKNTGFTNTVNEGLRRATKDIIIIMNDDITLKKGDLDRFYKIKSFGIFSPKTVDEGEGDRFGSIWGMNRDTYKVLGDLDESYPHFFSDTEYYNRAKRLGVKIVKWHDIVIDHESSATYNKIENREQLYLEDQKRSENE